MYHRPGKVTYVASHCKNCEKNLGMYPQNMKIYPVVLLLDYFTEAAIIRIVACVCIENELKLQ